MPRFLENWRQKSESTRRVAALSISAGVTVIIALIWGTVFFRSTVKEVGAVPAEIKKGPIQAIGESTGRAWTAITDQFKKIGEDLENIEKSIATSTDPTTTTITTTIATSTAVEAATTSPRENP